MALNYFFPIALSSFLTLLFAVVLYVGKLPKRKLWQLWLAVGLIVSIAILLGYAHIEDIVYGDRDSSRTFFNVLIQQIIILITNFALIFCVSKAKFDVSLLCFILSVATSRMAADIYGILSLIEVFRFNWVSLEGVPVYIDVANILNWIIFYIIHFIFAGGIYFVFKKISTENRVENMYLVGMSFCVLFICLVMDGVISAYLYDGGVVAVTIRFVLILCSLFVLILIKEVQRGSLIKSELGTAEKIIAQQARQYEQSSKNIELINIKCHDLRKQIRRMGDSNGVDVEEIAEIVRVYDSSVKTGNDTLDVILTGYGLRFDAEKVEFCCMIDGRKFSGFAVSDLHALFGNLLDNALEYLSSFKEEEKKFVRMNTKERGEYFMLIVENYFEGDIVSDKEGNIITSKEDKDNHGFGIRSIKYITEKYGGFSDIDVSNGLFTVRCCFPNGGLKN